MHSVTIKVIAFFVSAFLIVMAISQIYMSFTDGQDTVEATYISVSDSVDFKGIYVRNETVLSGSYSGVIEYLYTDGSKIAKNSVIAEIYSNETSIDFQQKIEKIKSEINGLERAINPGTQLTAQPEFLSDRIDELYLNLHAYIADSDYDKIESTKSEIQVLMNMLSLITETQDEEVINNRISTLNSQISKLNSGVSRPLSQVISSDTGYFVCYTDGLEGQLNFDTLSSITPGQLSELLSAQYINDYQTIGKVLESYTWKMAGIVDLSSKFIQGTSLRLRLSGSSVTVPVVLESLTAIDNSDKSVIILSCNQLSKDMLQSRTENVSLIFNEYSGIRVPRKAIHFKDGIKGVYIAVGQNIKFKKLDIVYEGDDYVISRNTSDTNYVVLYDQILLGEVNYVESTVSETESDNGGETDTSALQSD